MFTPRTPHTPQAHRGVRRLLVGAILTALPVGALAIAEPAAARDTSTPTSAVPPAEPVEEDVACEFDNFDDWMFDELDADVVAELNAESEALAAALEAAGIEYTTTVDPSGLVFVEYDWEDPAVLEVVLAFYTELYPIDEQVIADLNAETAALAEHLAAAGIEFTSTVDSFGLNVVEYDENDPAAQAAVEEFYTELYSIDFDLAVDAPIEPLVDVDSGWWTPTAEELAALNAETEALAADLEAAGIEFTVSTDASGFTYVEYDWNDPAAILVVDSFYAELYPIDAEILAEINAEADALAAALAAAGISHSVSVDAWGITVVEYDYSDPAATDVVDAFYAAQYPLDAELIAQWSAEAEALAAALEAAGILHTVSVDAWGVTVVEYDYTDPAAADVVEAFYAELYPIDDFVEFDDVDGEPVTC